MEGVKIYRQIWTFKSGCDNGCKKRIRSRGQMGRSRRSDQLKCELTSFEVLCSAVPDLTVEEKGDSRRERGTSSSVCCAGCWVVPVRGDGLGFGLIVRRLLRVRLIVPKLAGGWPVLENSAGARLFGELRVISGSAVFKTVSRLDRAKRFLKRPHRGRNRHA